MMPDRSASGRCWLCAEVRDDLSEEHVLSSKHFGAELVAPKAFCQRCNRLAGEVELLVAGGPWISEGVAKFRTGQAPRPRAYPRVKAITDEGLHVFVEERADGLKVVDLIPEHVATDDDGTEVWLVEAGSEAAYEARQFKKKKRVRAVGRELDSMRPCETQRGIGTKTLDAWGRFVAKVILGSASLFLPDDWLDGKDAAKFRSYFFRRPVPRDFGGMPMHAHEQPFDREPWSLLEGTHLISFHRSQDHDGTRFLLAMFGYLAAMIELPQTTCPPDEPSWLVPSDFAAPVRVRGDQLEAEMRRRAGSPKP